jgi:hypothetical protein
MADAAVKGERQVDSDFRNWFSGAVRVLVVVALFALALLAVWVLLSDSW